MSKGQAFIEVKIDVHEPVELEDFVRAFTSVGNQYKRYMRHTNPDLTEDAMVFVHQVRQGSIIAELVPHAGSLISMMDQLTIIKNFIDAYDIRLGAYFKKDGRANDVTKSELADFGGQIAAIASAADGKGSIRAKYRRENGEEVTEASIEFDNKSSKRAIEEIERHKEELDRVSSADHKRVLMVFKRSDIGDAAVGKKSGERVVIEVLSEKDLPLIYASELSEQEIKAQMRNTDENIYHKGFVVDVNVTTKAKKPVAYAVTNVHQIIDIEE